jgi:hypothetical protein
MIKPDVLLLDSGLNVTPGLSNVDLPMCTGDALNTQCFQAEVILDRVKKTDDLPRWAAPF